MKSLTLSKSLIFGVLLVAALPSTAQPLSESVQFYFSDAGGSDERLFTDVVTSAGWTKEYDIHVKNVWHSPIEFLSAILVVGYAVTNSFGPNATPIPFSDLVSIRYPDQAGLAISQNPNITAIAPWNVEGPGGNPFLGGASGPPFGQPRPYGLVIQMSVGDLPSVQTLHVGETMFLARISFKNRFLFQLGGETTLSLPAGDGAALGSTALRDNRGPLPKSYRTANWEQNSTLRLTPVPEPATLIVLGLGSALFLRRKRAAR
jgi:hypothetical protein